MEGGKQMKNKTEQIKRSDKETQVTAIIYLGRTLMCLCNEERENVDSNGRYFGLPATDMYGAFLEKGYHPNLPYKNRFNWCPREELTLKFTDPHLGSCYISYNTPGFEPAFYIPYYKNLGKSIAEKLKENGVKKYKLVEGRITDFSKGGKIVLSLRVPREGVNLFKKSLESELLLLYSNH